MASSQPGAELAPNAYSSGPTSFTGLITRDGSTGYAAEAGRYQLYASLACPWSHRALIVREVLGLEQVIGVSLTDPIRDERGWRFPASTAGSIRSPAPGTSLTCTWPATRGTRGGSRSRSCGTLRSQRIVTNDVPQITVMLETEFRAYHRPGAPDLYPEELRPEIDALGTLIFHAVSSGVYKAGLATSQAAYEEAFDTLFATLAALEERLSTAQVPGRRPAHRGRRAAVPDPGPVRCRVPHPLQVQSAPAHRLPEPVGVRPGSVPAARLRRHDRFRCRSSGTTTRPRTGSTQPGSFPKVRT